MRNFGKRLGAAVLAAVMILLLCGTASAATTYELPRWRDCVTDGTTTDRWGREITLLPVTLTKLSNGRTPELNKYDEYILDAETEYVVSVDMNYLFGRDGKRAGDDVDIDVNVIYDGYMHRRESGVIYVEMTDNETGWRHLSRVYLTHGTTATMPISMQAGVSRNSLSTEPILCTRTNNTLKFTFYTGSPNQSPPSSTNRGRFMSGYGRIDLDFYTFNYADALGVGFVL